MAARKAQALAAKHEQDCLDAARRGEVNGRAEGFQSGAKFACSLVLACARLVAQLIDAEKEGRNHEISRIAETPRPIKERKAQVTISDERLRAFCQRNHINLLVTLDAFIADTRALLAEAVAQERERCGKLCDAEANYRAERYGNPLLGDSPMIQGHKEVTARKLAVAIRSRSQPQTKEDERG